MKRARPGRGFTLVELLVVLAIVAAITAIAIPTFARLGVNSRNELQRGAKELFSMYRAAQIYAVTFRVKTAVVYNLDNYTDPVDRLGNGVPNNLGLQDGIHDSITNVTTRVIRQVAIMYQLPPRSNEFAGKYVPIPREDGIFRELPNQIVVSLENMQEPNTADATYFFSNRPRVVSSDSSDPDRIDHTAAAGLRYIQAYPEGTGPMADVGTVERNIAPVTFLAHVFTPAGGMDAPGSKEKFTMYVAPMPDTPFETRLINPEIPLQTRPDPSDPNNPSKRVTNLISLPVDLYRSSGRAQTGS